jgi:putative ABC transport system permease protein
MKLFLSEEDFREFSGDIGEIYQYKIECGLKFRAKTCFWLRVLESIPEILKDILIWRSIMIKNYLKIAYRNFRRHKGYSFINIIGLAARMAVCLMILVYVRHESSYDNYHKDADRIYRVAQDIRTATSNRIFAPVSPMVAPTLKTDFPQVEQAGRAFTFVRTRLVRRGDTFFYEERFMYADQELLDILTIPFVQGDPQTALSKPWTLVLSERMVFK